VLLWRDAPWPSGKEMNEELANLAARHYGVFDAAQWREPKLCASTLHHQVRMGRIDVLHPGVYSPAGAWPAWERSLMAAVLAAGDGAAVSHRSAARLWDIGHRDDDLVEITVPYPRVPRLRNVVVHRSRDLQADHLVVSKYLPVTKPARTVVDLAAVVSPAEVEDALDRALAKRLITVAGVEWMLGEVSRRGRRGVRVVGRILDQRALGTARPDGLLEPRMARLLKRAGLPPASFQYEIRDRRGRRLARVDFAYPEILLAIEVDGYEIHGSPGAMAKDFVRQNGLVATQWRVLRFTWGQVVREPDMVAAAIADAICALS
jgi:hypothetical protein